MFYESYIFKYGKTVIFFCICLYILGSYLELKKLKVSAILLLLFSYYFFRKPRFQIDPSDEVIRAPSYGKIYDVKLKTINNIKFIHISTLINIFDEHIQYAPCNGKIEKMVYKKGEFYPVYFVEKSNYNERMLYYQNTKHGKVIFSQIAGLIARTIVPFVQPGQVMTQGEEIGLIKFGSRSDIFIPYDESFEVMVKPGDKVYGGQTIMGAYKKSFF